MLIFVHRIKFNVKHQNSVILKNKKKQKKGKETKER